MAFVGNEDVETDILNSVDTRINVLEEALAGIYTKIVHVRDVKIFHWHHTFVNSVHTVFVSNVQSRKLIWKISMMTKMAMKRQVAIQFTSDKMQQNPGSGPPRTAFVHAMHRVSVQGASLGWSSLCQLCWK